MDVLPSSRHVRVEFNGTVLAETRRPRFLLETGLRRRTYIPKTDCNPEFLVDSQTTTQCPYKVQPSSRLRATQFAYTTEQGVASYYSVRLPDGTEEQDSVWWYRNPNPECTQVQGLAAFYDEKFDVYIDGELQKR